MELSPTLTDLLPGGPTELRWPWLALAVLALLVGLLTWWLRQERRAPAGAVLVSHTARLAHLPRFRVLVRRRRRLAVVRVLAAALTVAGCLLLLARPSAVVTEVDRPSRDLVVCLDVSASMERANVEVVRAVQEVVASLPGDRVGLTLFNGVSVVKFPLTDDQTYVQAALGEARAAFEERTGSYYFGTDAVRSSQIGDGLHSCVRGFDRLEERRGRVVLVVSDNRPLGRPVHELSTVARQARDRGVVVHALAPARTLRRPDAAEELRAAVETTGGSLAVLGEDAAGRVVERIDRVERERLAEPPRQRLDDRPQAGVLLTTAAGAVLTLLWARRRW